MKIRVGQGIDVHEFVAGRKLILGGVEIPYEKGLLGHSDADALLHAITDAILGAAGKGDIGQHFPNTDIKWKDSNSIQLLQIIWDQLKIEGWKVLNVDATVLLEAPKLVPHIPKMKENISSVLGISVDDIGIKATTTEKLGFVGRKEGIMAQAVALLSR